MAFDNMLAIWPFFITFVQHFIDCLFLRVWCLKTEVCLFEYLHSPFPKPTFFPPLDVINMNTTSVVLSHVSVGRQSSRFSFQPTVTLWWLFHWLFSILWFNMCKPVKSADGESVKTLLGLNSMWLKTTALQKAGVTNEKDVTVLKKNFLQLHATNNHSDIIFLLKFLLMVFLSDAWWLVVGHFRITEKPNSAVSGRSCCSAASQCIHPHCTTDSLWSGQHLLSVFSQQQILFNIYSLKKKNHNFLKTIRIPCYNAQFQIM